MPPDFQAAHERLARAVATGEVPSVVAVAGDGDHIYPVAALGVTRYDDEGRPADQDTVYDLASLTKVVATLPAILRLADAGELSFEDPLGRFFSNAGWFKNPSLADTTLRALLSHGSGLPAWKAVFAQVSERLTGLANVMQTELAHPPGSYVYSDIGFMLLGAVVERVSGMRQDAFVRREVFEPLGMTRTAYGPVLGAWPEPGSGHPTVAATEDCGWRNRILQGEVHDENAFALAGVAGHAGLFGIASDLARYAQAWLNSDPRLAGPELLDEARREQLQDPATGLRRSLGWQLQGASAGSLAGPQVYGHTGFTGTSLFLDPARGSFAVLLTNRVHPSRRCGQTISQLRADYHDAVARAFDS